MMQARALTATVGVVVGVEVVVVGVLVGDEPPVPPLAHRLY